MNDGFSKITSLLPGIIGLSSMTYTSPAPSGAGSTSKTTVPSMTASGISPDDTTIVDYVRELRNSAQFSEVLITNMNENEYNEWQFTLTMK